MVWVRLYFDWVRLDGDVFCLGSGRVIFWLVVGE